MTIARTLQVDCASLALLGVSPLDALRKLKDLFDGGVLTDSEFNSKKTEFLARLYLLEGADEP
jgi:hypothetical protein